MSLTKGTLYIESAYEQLQVISQDKQKRIEYEAREKAIRDYNQMMFEAKESGREEGIEIGREEGIEKGKLEITKNLIVLGYSTDEIINITKLTAQAIDSIREQ